VHLSGIKHQGFDVYDVNVHEHYQPLIFSLLVIRH
jgi:hypothetical protein